MSQGSRYNKDLSSVEIAKRIRADIKAAQKAGELPAMTVSVRYERVTHSSAIRIYVRKWEGQIWNVARAREDVQNPSAWSRIDNLSRKARSILDSLKDIANAYNYDKSDISSDYFNVNFYLTVDFDYELKNASQKATEATVRAAYAVAA